MASLEYAEIKQFLRGALYEGKLKIHQNGIVFKNNHTGKLEQLAFSDINEVCWLRVSFGYELKVWMNSGHVFKFDGFRESEHETISEFLKPHGVSFRRQDVSLKGWNWGDVKYLGDIISFNVEENKPAFEIPLGNVVKSEMGKNEVAVEFHPNEDCDVGLVEMRFYIPPTAGYEADPVKQFHEHVMSRVDVVTETGNAIVSFDDVQCWVPKGRHDVKLFPNCLQMRGKTNLYNVPYSHILRMFLLPHNDGQQIYFVISLDPPLRQGLTRYHFIIYSFFKDDELIEDLNIPPEDIATKYEGKLTKEMEGPVFEILSRVLKAVANRKITVPGTFKGKSEKSAIYCSYKSHMGFLYPLERGFLYLHKPTMHLRFEEIVAVNFARATSTLRSFDFDVETKQQQTFTFSQIDRAEYSKLFDFVKSKGLAIRNIGDSTHDSDVAMESSDDDSHDPYLARMKKEGEDRRKVDERHDSDSDSDDSDFAPGEDSGAEVAEEYDSEASYVTSSDEDDDGEKKKTKRKIAKTIKEPEIYGKKAKSQSEKQAPKIEDISTKSGNYKSVATIEESDSSSDEEQSPTVSKSVPAKKPTPVKQTPTKIVPVHDPDSSPLDSSDEDVSKPKPSKKTKKPTPVKTPIKSVPMHDPDSSPLDSSDEEVTKPKPSKKPSTSKSKTSSKSTPVKGSEKKTKKKKEKDPNAPKRPMSSYMIWLGSIRDQIKRDNPHCTFSEIGKIAGEKWRNMSAEEKQPFNQQADKAKKAYDVAMQEYKKS